MNGFPPDPPAVVGHRGAAGLAPENTLCAIRRAAAAGVGAVEFDVRITADGEIVLMHDETVDRTTDGSGAVHRMALDEIRRLDAGAWYGPGFAGEPVPGLADAIRLLDETGLAANIEIKASTGHAAATVERLTAVVRAHWPDGKAPPLLTGFGRETMQALASHAPDLPRGLLADRLPADWRALVGAWGCRAVHLGAAGLAAREITAVHEASLPLLVWTVNDRDQARALFAAGVDGVFTDRPDLVP